MANPNGGILGNVFCGGSLTLENTGAYTVTAPGFACTPENCVPAYTWNVQGPATGNGTGNSFNFNFSLAGSYVITFSVNCGNKECEPCKVTIVILGCECKGWTQNSPGTVSNSDGAILLHFPCGASFSLPVGNYYQFTAPGFTCSPDNCVPTFKWDILGPSSWSGTGSTYTTNFPIAGTYTVTITPYCGDKRCEPCIITVQTSIICDCGRWSTDKPGINITHNGAEVGEMICNGSITLRDTGYYQLTIPTNISGYTCNFPDCQPSYRWELKAPGPYTIAGLAGTETVTVSFLAAGTYTLTITPVCGNRECEKCRFTIKIPPTCDCKGWIREKPVIIHNPDGTAAGNVYCGDTVRFSNTGTYQFTSPGYFCNPDNCPVTYKWKVAGPVSGNGSGNPFSFNFSLPGTYTVVIVPLCGNRECEPCIFTVIIPSDCKCTGWIRDIPGTFKNPNGLEEKTFFCNDTVRFDLPGTHMIYPPGFTCTPANCVPYFTWEVFGPVSGSGSGTPLTFNFSSPGNYTVVITPWCGNQKCEPCKFTVVIRSDCLCLGWIKDKPGTLVDAAGNITAYIFCGSEITLPNTGYFQLTAPGYACSGSNCDATYLWEFSGTASVTTIGNPLDFNFTAPGTYYVTLTAWCGNQKCEPCRFIIKIPSLCDCKGWVPEKPGSIQIPGAVPLPVYCDSTINLQNTGTYVITAPGYLCSTDNCPLTYAWKVFGPVSGTGTGNPFSFNFSLPGTYTVVFTPYCGSMECPPCKFRIVIRESCRCEGWIREKPVIIHNPDGTAAGNVYCGDTVRFSNTGTYQFTSPGYFCNPDNCPVTYKWKVAGPVSGNGSGNPFSFNFSLPGTYTVVIVPLCGNRECEPCIFTVIIPSDCKCTGWIRDIPGTFKNPNGLEEKTFFCNDTVRFDLPGTHMIYPPGFTCTPANCVPYFTWEVFGPVSGSGSGTPLTFNFSSPGNYTVVITPWCGNQKCEPCKFTVVIRSDCLCLGWIKDKPGTLVDAAGNITAYIFCGSEITLPNTGYFQLTAPGYACSGSNCDATYLWEFSGTASVTTIGNPLDFNFTAPGTYYVTLTAWCGNQKCEPCRFIIKIPSLCDCKGWVPEKPGSIQIPGAVPLPVYCDSTINLQNTGSYLVTAPAFTCSPETCTPTWKWEVAGPTAASSGTGTGNPFSFNFAVAGNYTVTITPVCGNNVCPPCKFIVVIQPPCECKGWSNNDKPVSFTTAAGVAGTVFCNGNLTLQNTGTYLVTAPAFTCSPETCTPTWKWEVAGPTAASSGTGTGNPFSFNFAVSGNYTVTITPVCGNNVCPPCKFIVVIQPPCECKGWSNNDKPVSFTTAAGVAGTVFCNGNLTLQNTGTYLVTAPAFTCSPETCTPTWKWEVAGPTAASSGTGAGNPFSFNFAVSGNYTVTITPVCGNNVCPPCKFSITIRSACECKGWIANKPGIITSTANVQVATIHCDSTITLQITGTYQLTPPGFVCSPETCTPTYKWVISGPVPGSGSGNPFTFNFSLNGTYSVVITPVCGDITCPECKFIIVIKPATCDCKGTGWIKDKPVVIQSTSGQVTGNVLCDSTINIQYSGTYQITAPDYLCNPVTCAATYSWSIQGPLTGSGNGKIFSFNFSLAGTYVVTIIPYCGDLPCPPCKFTIVIRTVVGILEWKNDEDFRYSIIPNPNNGQFVFRLKSDYKKSFNLNLVNPLGQTIDIRHVKPAGINYSENFDTRRLSKGIYLLIISNDLSTVSEKIIVL